MIPTSLQLNVDATQALIAWAQQTRAQAATPFEAAQQLVKKLGIHLRDDGLAEVGFWIPDLLDKGIADDAIMLECLTPTRPIDFTQQTQQLDFSRSRVRLLRDGEYAWGVIDGMVAGNRDQIGTFYWLVYQDVDGIWQHIHDHLAYSIPFGVFAPAEFYDLRGVLAERNDKAHYHDHLDTEPDPDGVPRVQYPSNILQAHAFFSSETQSIAGLTRIYQTIAVKIKNGDELSPAEKHFTGYDAIQLMPIEPTIEYEGAISFWNVVENRGDSLTVALRNPDMTNWGYDVVISASPATNPVLLESKRPHELLDFIETCHHFPGKPIKVMLDIVYGHIDNQGLPLLNSRFFAGANMYGQNVNFLEPTVRAILLEMMRRKHNYGVDGIRVDGAQDFKWWDSETDTMIHDDDFLHLMNDIELDVDGITYRPWMIFEDGRPWPRDDWELASTYRELTKQMPNVWQWGPLTFAHNTPFLFTFWASKWWRIREMADIGREWITGCANHDTLRRGSQVPLDSRINTYLGATLPDVIEEAYDNPAAKLFDYAMMPGIPMEFLNGNFRAPWGFVRNTDDRYGVKVVSEESRWLHWRLNHDMYAVESNFTRLKSHGFTTLDGLRRFMNTLDHVVQATDYTLSGIVSMMNNNLPRLEGPELTVQLLKDIAKDFMDDVAEFCNVARKWEMQAPERSAYTLNVREFRRARPWLIENLRDEEDLRYLHPSEGAIIFYGWRFAPASDEQIAFIANMEGAARTITPADLPIPNINADGWQLALATPGLDVPSVHEPVTLADSRGMVFVRNMD